MCAYPLPFSGDIILPMEPVGPFRAQPDPKAQAEILDIDANVVSGTLTSQ